MTRYKDHVWQVQADSFNRLDTQDCVLSVLMDIRDELKLITAELKRSNSTLCCTNMLAVPQILRRISRNTAKPRKPKS